MTQATQPNEEQPLTPREAARELTRLSGELGLYDGEEDQEEQP